MKRIDASLHFTQPSRIVPSLVLFWLLVSVQVGCSSCWASRNSPGEDSSQHHRPSYVLDRLQNQQPLYYFGIGSNMLRSKLENRGSTKIEVLSFQPALVKNYRLAFTMRGFLPLEPGMGSLEPVEEESSFTSEATHIHNVTNSTVGTNINTTGTATLSPHTNRPYCPLFPYTNPETHGALVKLSPDNYEKLMASEGVSHNNTNAGYEEIVVNVYPYSSPQSDSVGNEGEQNNLSAPSPVQAVALRVRDGRMRIRKEPCPSLRYMNILRQGAKELGLTPSYQQYLQSHPTHTVPKWIRSLALYNMFFTFSLSRILNSRFFSRLQSQLLFTFYVPATSSVFYRIIYNIFTALVILPGALIGAFLKGFYTAVRRDVPPFWTRLESMLGDKERENEGTQ